MPPSDTPGAAEIEAAVKRARLFLVECDDMPAGYSPWIDCARALLAIHAQVATLTARAEAAEAQCRDVFDIGYNHQTRAEALAARVATLEAALRDVEVICASSTYADIEIARRMLVRAWDAARAALTPRDGGGDAQS